jgi:acyl carrier protein
MTSNKIIEIISRNLEINIEECTIDKDLTSFDNWSSLTQLFIVSDIEQSFNIQFEVDEIESTITVAGLLSIVESKIGK